MTNTTYRLPGRLPTSPQSRRPLILQVLMPLRVWALIAFVLTAWPLLQFVWLALLAGGCVWLVVRSALSPHRSAASATRAAAAPLPAPLPPRRPANTISRASGRL